MRWVSIVRLPVRPQKAIFAVCIPGSNSSVEKTVKVTPKKRRKMTPKS